VFSCHINTIYRKNCAKILKSLEDITEHLYKFICYLCTFFISIIGIYFKLDKSDIILISNMLFDRVYIVQLGML